MSWHKYFADAANCRYEYSGERDENGDRRRYVDLCTYRTFIVLGIFLHVLVISCAGLILTGICIAAYYIWVFIMDHPGVFFTALFFGTLALGYIQHVPAGKKRVYKEPGMLSQMYDSWKNKYCVRIEVKD